MTNSNLTSLADDAIARYVELFRDSIVPTLNQVADVLADSPASTIARCQRILLIGALDHQIANCQHQLALKGFDTSGVRPTFMTAYWELFNQFSLESANNV